MRREFSTKTKAAAWERSQGLCEHVSNGIRCGLPLHHGKYTYDHILPDWLGGEPTLENCQVLGRCCCDKPKTAADQGRIAKTKRQRNAHAGIRKPRSILGWRRFDGTIVRATRER